MGSRSSRRSAPARSSMRQYDTGSYTERLSSCSFSIFLNRTLARSPSLAQSMMESRACLRAALVVTRFRTAWLTLPVVSGEYTAFGLLRPGRFGGEGARQKQAVIVHPVLVVFALYEIQRVVALPPHRNRMRDRVCCRTPLPPCSASLRRSSCLDGLQYRLPFSRSIIRFGVYAPVLKSAKARNRPFRRTPVAFATL